VIDILDAHRIRRRSSSHVGRSMCAVAVPPNASFPHFPNPSRRKLNKNCKAITIQSWKSKFCDGN